MQLTAKLPLAFSRTVIPGFESPHAHILLSDGSGNSQTGFDCNFLFSKSYCDSRSAGQSVLASNTTWAQDQIFVTVRKLRFCWCVALSLTRGRGCHLPRSQSVVYVIYCIFKILYVGILHGQCQVFGSLWILILYSFTCISTTYVCIILIYTRPLSVYAWHSR
jgi:hypothetical protein